MPLFDKYPMDLALQGHATRISALTHARRTKGATAREGTIYIISVPAPSTTRRQRTTTRKWVSPKVSTYRCWTFRFHGNRLVYRAHDMEGKVRDEFVIEK